MLAHIILKMCRREALKNSIIIWFDFFQKTMEDMLESTKQQCKAIMGDQVCCNKFLCIPLHLCHAEYFYVLHSYRGAQWLSGRVLDSRLRGHGFEPHRRGSVVSFIKTHYSPTFAQVR